MCGGTKVNWFDPIESEVRARAREFIEEMIPASSTLCLPAPVTGEARLVAMKKVWSLLATATAAVRGLWPARSARSLSTERLSGNRDRSSYMDRL